ncbi:MAG: 50S ribosomal protein L11 methyltransferase [Nitrospirae bacterium]|jgi:ribosomal protein L11 methylase PrmA|nr:50S ribosomal protein L11 methyltransferase [Nitrospirota bacterium]
MKIYADENIQGLQWYEIIINMPLALLESTYNFLWFYVNGLTVKKDEQGFSLKAYVFSLYPHDLLKKLQKILRIQARSFNVEYEVPSVNHASLSLTDDFIIVPHPTPHVPPFGISIFIQRGRAFGTGSHPCTIYCLEGLKSILKSNSGECYTGKILDAGMGTGILSIAAGKLGAKDITAVDINDESIKEAQENIILNDLTGAIHIFHCSITDVRGQFNIILANLYGSLLLEISSSLVRQLIPQGWLIAGGMNIQQSEMVIPSFTQYGLKEYTRYFDEEWSVVVLKKL